MIKSILFALSIAVSGQAAAIPYANATITFQPAAPAAGEPIAVVTGAPAGTCLTFTTGVNVDVAQKTILVGVSGDDFEETPCPVNRVAPRANSIGALPRGTYQVTFVSCAFNAPPEEPPCSILATELLLVGGGDPVQVPASSGTALAFLTLGCLLLGWRAQNAFGS